MTPIPAILLVFLATVIGAIASLYLKIGSSRLKFRLVEIISNKFLVVGILLYGISTIPFIFSLRLGDLSVLYPLASLSYLWVAILSHIYLKEKITVQKSLGMFAIIAGVIIMGLA